MRLKHMALLGLLCMSANSWALMSKKCDEPKHKEDYVRYVCWYSETRVREAYAHHLKDMKEKLPAYLHPYLLTALTPYIRQTIPVSANETLVYERVQHIEPEGYYILWVQNGVTRYRMEIRHKSPGFFDRSSGAVVNERVYR